MMTFVDTKIVSTKGNHGHFHSIEPRRRFRTVEEKRRIVAEALEPYASVARVARTHGVNANQLFGWRRLYLRGRFAWKGPRRGRCGEVGQGSEGPRALSLPAVK